MYYRILFILLFIIVSVSLTAAENKPGLTLKETFDLYVQSVQHSDLNGLLSTVSDSKDFFFLTSSGKLINTREKYKKFHEQWFQESKWEWPVELLEIHEGTDYGYTTAIYHYKSSMPEGDTYYLDSYFTLIFHKENDMWKVVSDIATPIDRSISEANSELKYTMDQANVFDVMMNYSIVRKYKSTPVPKEHIMKILNAARMAPTANNQQSWKFLVIENKEKIQQLKEAAFTWYFEKVDTKNVPDPKKLEEAQSNVKQSLENVLSAPVYVAVLVDSNAKYTEDLLHEGSLAAGYLMIAAKALGYGTGLFMSFFPESHMKEFFKIPDNYKLICFTPIGVPEGIVRTSTKKPLKDLVVFESF
jgi:5,6-dimethylbenzimidazole synthase